MSRSTTWVVRIVGLVVVGAAIVWVLRPRPLMVTVGTVTRGPLDATVVAEAKTRVKDLFTVAAPVDGELERISFKQGEPVALASVVAHILPVQSRPLDPRSRAEAQAAVSSARASVERAVATEKEAAAALAHAESTLETTRRLANERVVAANDLEHAGHELEIRQQALQASRAALTVARSELVRAEAAASSSTTATGRTLTTVRAPVAGRVLRVLRESAGPIAAGTPILEIGDTAALEIAADFLTTDATSVRPGAAATIRDWGDGPPLRARVSRIDPAAFTKVSPLGLEEQRVSVMLDFVDPRPPSLGHDFHLNVAIVTWHGDDVLRVPATALFRVGEDWAVYVVRDGRVAQAKVVIGRTDGAHTVIERGLDAGAVVVVQPSDTVRDGARVTIAS